MPRSIGRNAISFAGSFGFGLLTSGLVCVAEFKFVGPASLFFLWPSLTLFILPASWMIFGLNESMTLAWINACRIAFIFGWLGFIVGGGTYLVAYGPV